MGYRIHFLAFPNLPQDKLETSLRQRGAFEDDFFSNPQVFVTNESWSAIGVSTRFGICAQFEDLISELKAPSIWITTNETDDWQIRIHDGSGELAKLHIPWVNVDPEEHQEQDGKEVADELRASNLPAELQEKMGALGTSDAWRAFLDYAQAELTQSMEKASIPVDAEKLRLLFSEDDFGDIESHEASQLGYFINAVLGIGFDLSPADD